MEEKSGRMLNGFVILIHSKRLAVISDYFPAKIRISMRKMRLKDVEVLIYPTIDEFREIINVFRDYYWEAMDRKNTKKLLEKVLADGKMSKLREKAE